MRPEIPNKRSSVGRKSVLPPNIWKLQQEESETTGPQGPQNLGPKKNWIELKSREGRDLKLFPVFTADECILLRTLGAGP